MKPPSGYAKPRRLAAPKRPVQLHLRRQPIPTPDEDAQETEPKSPFWKWVGLVALFHVLLIGAVGLFYEITPHPAPPPPDPFIDLLPPGDTVKGTAGAQEAPKLGPTTPAPTVHVHHDKITPPPKPVTPPPPVAVQPPPAPVPPPVEPVVPKPIVKADVPALIPEKPTPPKPKPPKVKVDLTLADGPTPVVDKHVTKPKLKPHVKPVAATPPDTTDAPESNAPAQPENTGLSKEQIAAKLGAKLEAAGATTAEHTGTSGSTHARDNPFADFYLSLHDQVMSKWEHPNLTDETAINPVVMIHVEKDGRVPPEGVILKRSSGNPAYDDSAVAAAKSIGYTLQPLPDGCPPDVSITFKLTR